MNTKNSELGITWLGQGGFIIDCGNTRVVVDPYLSDSLARDGMKRSFPPPFRPEEIDPDIICCTHDHPDHFDEPTLLQLYKMCHNCVILGPDSVIEHCRRLGFNPARMVTIRPNDNTFSYEGVRIQAVKAYHDDQHAIGLAIRAGAHAIYISGDTQRHSGLIESVVKAFEGSPDIMMVCINGRHTCMDDVDALRLTKALEPAIVMPMNYGLFTSHTADPRPFIDAVNRFGIEGLMPDPGKKITFPLDTPLSTPQEPAKDPTEQMIAELEYETQLLGTVV